MYVYNKITLILNSPEFSCFLLFIYDYDYDMMGFVLCIDDRKNSHLRELEGAKERLTLCRADLLDFQSLREAISGCDGVFHTASPVTDDPVSVLTYPPITSSCSLR